MNEKITKSCAIVALSDPIPQGHIVNDLKALLEKQGAKVYISEYLYFKTDGSLKAEELKKFYKMNLDYILDVSGGNLSLDTLYYMDFRAIKESDTTLIGYSDLTTILNAIYTITKKSSYLYQPRFLLNRISNLKSFDIQYLRGEHLEGTVIGGNVRCFLKLVGTTYFPDVIDKILFLEAYGGDQFLIESYFAQLRLLGVFDKIKGLFLGTFTELEKNGDSIDVIALKYYKGPIIKTTQIGHAPDSKCLTIGGDYEF